MSRLLSFWPSHRCWDPEWSVPPSQVRKVCCVLLNTWTQWVAWHWGHWCNCKSGSFAWNADRVLIGFSSVMFVRAFIVLFYPYGKMNGIMLREISFMWFNYLCRSGVPPSLLSGRRKLLPDWSHAPDAWTFAAWWVGACLQKLQCLTYCGTYCGGLSMFCHSPPYLSSSWHNIQHTWWWMIGVASLMLWLYNCSKVHIINLTDMSLCLLRDFHGSEYRDSHLHVFMLIFMSLCC
jgi:hypothetical protein